jgi:hypothetical protein
MKYNLGELIPATESLADYKTCCQHEVQFANDLIAAWNISWGLRKREKVYRVCYVDGKPITFGWWRRWIRSSKSMLSKLGGSLKK